MSQELSTVLPQFYPFLTSLGLGLIMGLERERRPAAKAGLRTFGLTALLGTSSAMLAQSSGALWLLPVAWLCVALMMIAADRPGGSTPSEPDTTSTVALLLCFAFGAMLWYGYTLQAVALTLATTALLYFKTELHAMAHLNRQEMVSLLQFATISFVILPLLPDRGLGPFGALNPYRIWLMVVLIAGISLAGYVALRLLGERRLPVLLGLLGGLVSSTATTLLFARKVSLHPQQQGAATVVIGTANLMLLLRVLVVTTVVAPGAVQGLLPVIVPGLLMGALWLGLRLRRSPAMTIAGDGMSMRNPLEMGAALGFGALYAAALLLTAWLNQRVGTGGVYAVAMLLGLTDVDAATLSTLHLYGQNQLQSLQVSTALLLSVSANMVFKNGAALIIGGGELGLGVLRGYLSVLAGLWLGLLALMLLV